MPVPHVDPKQIEHMVAGCAGDPQKLGKLLAGLPAVQRDAAIGTAHRMFGNGFVEAAARSPGNNSSSIGGNTVGGSTNNTESIGKGGYTTTGHDEVHLGGGSVSRDSGGHVGPDGIGGHDSVTVNAGGKHVTLGGGGSIDPGSIKSPGNSSTTVGGNTVGASAVSTETIGKGGYTTTGHSEVHAGGGGVSRDTGLHVGSDGISGHDSVTLGAGGKQVTVGGSTAGGQQSAQRAEQWIFDRFDGLAGQVSGLRHNASSLGNAANKHDVGVRAGQAADKIGSFAQSASHKLGQAEHSSEWATLADIAQQMVDIIGVVNSILTMVATFGTVVPTTPISTQISICVNALGNITVTTAQAAYDAAVAAKAATETASNAANAGTNAVNAAAGAAQDGANNAGNAANQAGNAIKHGLGF